jgi:predicted nucleic acid-binding protein
MLVLDANILIRAVLGRRVRELLERYAVRGVRFLAPEAAFEEASKYLPMLLEKRGIPRDDVLASLAIRAARDGRSCRSGLLSQL